MTSTRHPHSPPPAARPAEPAGEQPTLASLVHAHQHMVWRYLRLVGADPHEADDLMQDTFVQFATGQREQPLHSPPAFLRGIARNLLLALRRRQRQQAPTSAWADAVDLLASADPHAFEDARVDALRTCIERLQGRARQAIELHHQEGLSRRETAARLDIGEEGIKSLLSRTRELLRQCVEQRTTTEDLS